MYHYEQFMNVLKTYTHSLMNQKELEEEQRLIAVNQLRKSELKAKKKLYASSTSFGRKIVSQYTLKFAEFLKDKYFAPGGEEVDNEVFIRRWNGAYDVLTVQKNSPGIVQK